jgi:hypothetical protein
MRSVLFFCLLGFSFITSAQDLNVELEVADSQGNLQTVQLAVDMTESDLNQPITLYMPHVIFPNGDLALISAKSDLDQVICEQLTGSQVRNPYRDLRTSSYEILSYRRGVFSGTYSVHGQKTSGYYEQTIGDSDLTIRVLSCSEY